VLIIMESFSREFSAYLTDSTGYMPFLDSLMQQSLFFPHAFANGKKTIEALPAILASLPTLMETPFVSSPYSANTINSLPGQLRRHGYHSSFFHGGINGTMGFDDFTRLAGIERYYGRNEFGNDKYYDGYWGIFDDRFFQYFAGKLDTFAQPFFSCFFSLSSHHPYTIPEKYIDKFPEGRMPIHRSIAYADYSLMKFFESIREKSWYENTLFVITADHTAQSFHPYFQNRVGDYAVPILYYHPGNPGLKGIDYRLTQHIDIMPSILDYIDSETSFIAFGSSVFSEQKTAFVVNYLNQLYQFMEDQWILFHDGEKGTGLFNFKTDSLLQRNLLDYRDIEPEHIPLANLEKRLKSIIQQYNSRMVNNDLRIK
jgi:phosphoglycerol transferase MdoB-like AlkP superfamily enzyme